jgi:hypothetical protein
MYGFCEFKMKTKSNKNKKPPKGLKLAKKILGHEGKDITAHFGYLSLHLYEAFGLAARAMGLKTGELATSLMKAFLWDIRVYTPDVFHPRDKSLTSRLLPSPSDIGTISLNVIDLLREKAGVEQLKIPKLFGSKTKSACLCLHANEIPKGGILNCQCDVNCSCKLTMCRPSLLNQLNEPPFTTAQDPDKYGK